jgi:hypothetical protein
MSGHDRRLERAAWLAVPLLLVGVLVVLIGLGSLGPPRPEYLRIDVAEALVEEDPTARWGSAEIELVGWYANLDADCRASAGESPDADWLERTCPLRLLLAEQPVEGADQAALEAIGLRLAAPTGEPFPPRPEPGGWHLMLEPLIVTGHFDDPAADACADTERDRCRTTFVVTEVDGLVH